MKRIAVRSRNKTVAEQDSPNDEDFHHLNNDECVYADRATSTGTTESKSHRWDSVPYLFIAIQFFLNPRIA
jgi:hypothetical protein